MTTSETVRRTSKPFPWRCPECRAKAVNRATLKHTAQVRHEGRLHTVELTELRVPRCDSCGAVIFDDDANGQIYDGLRVQLGLLLPAQILEARSRLKLKQRELASHLGVAEETISRWENGMFVQSKAMDNLLRLYFELPAARRFLAPLQEVQTQIHWTIHQDARPPRTILRMPAPFTPSRRLGLAQLAG
jgi:putative zinc finger/helix-turn-helix YgiT family protein